MSEPKSDRSKLEARRSQLDYFFEDKVERAPQLSRS